MGKWDTKPCQTQTTGLKGLQYGLNGPKVILLMIHDVNSRIFLQLWFMAPQSVHIGKNGAP